MASCGRLALRVFNGLARRVEPVRLDTKVLTWYQCGPTVYDHSHIGHAICFLRFDILRRIMQRQFGCTVFKAWGMTDIDDKIINRARELDEDPLALARRYEAEFAADMGTCHAPGMPPPA